MRFLGSLHPEPGYSDTGSFGECEFTMQRIFHRKPVAVLGILVGVILAFPVTLVLANRLHPDTKMLVASTGDNEQESFSTLSDYQQYFGATYQTFVDMGIFMQVRGNRDAQDAGHGAVYAAYFGANGHLDSRGQTNYSYDLGSWHIIGLERIYQWL